ncbi:hypothetical protein N665_0086s0071 [Sinapis alba]|nr:hypothetical protein N665_0086s0071 [Sinapis alba]
MEGNAFLLRVPCPNARRHILSQSLWQIDGQTMFVAKWSPGLQQEKPELDMIPVWLEFTGVPLQFFNRDALQEIAGIVGHPICLHPSTENLTNIEVAKVYTVIDPRKPLPEFVNARFESGDTRRISVSSPFLPSLCSYCKRVGHTISRCKAAPITCKTCNSVKHVTESCPRNIHNSSVMRDPSKGKAPVKGLLPIVPQPNLVYRKVRDNNKVASSQAVAPPFNSLTEPHPPQNTRVSLPHIATGGSKMKQPGHITTSLEYENLVEGGLYVDLTPVSASLSSHASESSLNSSDEGNFSGEEDNPYEGDDHFIEVISKRSKKLSKAQAREGGSLIL